MIYNNNFTDNLPSEISFNISRIEIGNNMFSSALPSAAIALKNFKQQDSGDIPATLGLMDLNILDLSINKLTDHIPQEFNDLHLNFLNLSSNQLTSEIHKP
uniref:Uncharacterized protein n=1 Tax=Oryza glumipatula TaxID=40148 RepID=A0A0D9YPL1_9ORYZ